MIVRDAARTLGPCLEGIRPWVDEMIVVDTGSVDQTPRLADSLGARVLHFPWCDDFAAARNESLRHAAGEWIFWMDADDTIDAANGSKLRALVDSARTDGSAGSPLGYVMQVHCPGPGYGCANDGSEATVVDHIKLFRNVPALRFEGRIHEQVLPAIRRLGGEVRWTDIHVVHSGSDQTPQGRRRKQERDLRLLELDRRDRPGHPFVLFNLGMTYADTGDDAQAAKALGACLAASDPGDSHVRKAYALLAASLNRTGQASEARAACDRGLALYPDDAELTFLRGLLLYRAGRAADAAAAFRSILATTETARGRYFASFDQGILGYKAHQNLGMALRDSGDARGAASHFRTAIRLAPRFAPAYSGLVELLLGQGKVSAADRLVRRMESIAARRGGGEELSAETSVLQALILEARGDAVGARSVLAGALARQPRCRELLRAWSRHLFEHGRVTDALQANTRLLEEDPQDPAAYHNRAALYARIGLYAESLRSCDRSLALRPHAAATGALRASILRRLAQARNSPDRAGRCMPAYLGAVATGSTPVHRP